MPAARARSEDHTATGDERGEDGSDRLGLRLTGLVEGYVGVALRAPGVVPLRAAVPEQDEAPHVRVSGMTGQSLQRRSRA